MSQAQTQPTDAQPTSSFVYTDEARAADAQLALTAVIKTPIPGIEFKWYDTPFSSLLRGCQTGFTHMLGSEASSQVVSRIRKQLGHTKQTPVNQEQVKAFSAANEDLVKAWKAEFIAERVKDIREGKLEERSIVVREPTRSTVDKFAMAKLAAAVERNFKTMSEKRVAKGDLPYTWTAKEVNDRVNGVMTLPQFAAKWQEYRAEAQREIDEINARTVDTGEDEVDEFALAVAA